MLLITGGFEFHPTNSTKVPDGDCKGGEEEGKADADLHICVSGVEKCHFEIERLENALRDFFSFGSIS